MKHLGPSMQCAHNAGNRTFLIFPPREAQLSTKNFCLQKKEVENFNKTIGSEGAKCIFTQAPDKTFFYISFKNLWFIQFLNIQ